MRCVVLHQQIAADAKPDEQDTLAAVAAVSDALGQEGHAVERLTLGLDFRPLAERLATDPPDFVFNLVDSLPGPRFPGPAGLAAAALLEASGIPFTGSPLAALALSGDKLATKRVLRNQAIPVPGGPEDGWRGPFIVKHATEHASFRLSPRSVQQKPPKDLPIGCFVEAFLPGREFNLSALEGPDGLRLLPPAELVYAPNWPAGTPRILDYAGKWVRHAPLFVATERHFDTIEPGLAEALCALARRALDALGVRGYGRVDIREDAAGVPRVLEVNANPALAPDAGFVAAARAGGLSYRALIARIAAVQRSCTTRCGAKCFQPRHSSRSEFRLRSGLTSTDASAIIRLVAASGFFSDAERLIASELVQAALQHGDASGYRFLLAERDRGHLLGYACFGPVPGTASSWDLYWIVVDKAEQGKGIGRALVERVSDLAAKERGTRLYAETSGRSLYAPTRRFYQAIGFLLEASLLDFYAKGDAKQIWTRQLRCDELSSGIGGPAAGP